MERASIGAILVVVLLVGGGTYAAVKQKERRPVKIGGYTFSAPRKSPHWESNTPAHAAILPAVPLAVVLDVNFDLAPPSSIKILKDKKDYGVAETTIDNNKLAVRRAMDPKAPIGLYQVEYSACWPDQSCHKGYFSFALDPKGKATMQDLRNQKSVTIRLSQIAFAPKQVRVSPGTTVTWINDDEVSHYVNTDPHAAHTYYPAQNSRELKKGERYTLTFSTPGVYPYHCSAHAASMVGTIVVE